MLLWSLPTFISKFGTPNEIVLLSTVFYLHVMEDYIVSVVNGSRDATILGEGPHWNGETNDLLYVDIIGQAIYRINTVTGETGKLLLGNYLSISYFGLNDNVYVNLYVVMFPQRTAKFHS